jgi:hypothetical protein
MKVAADGKPVVGTRRNMLGVRPTDPANTNPQRVFDVDAENDTDSVAPGQGLSTSIVPTPQRVQTGEALFVVETTELPAELAPNPDRPPHCLLEPTRPLTLAEYQQALADTRDLWQRVQ